MTKRSATSHIGHGLKRAITITYTTKQSVPVRTGGVPFDLAIIREDLFQTTDVLAVG